MSENVNPFEVIFEDILLRSYTKLLKDKNLKEDQVEDELGETLMKSAMLMANCFAPMMYKLARIKDQNPKFEPQKIILSQEAYNRVVALQKLKLIPEGRIVMNLPFRVSIRINERVYCKYE